MARWGSSPSPPTQEFGGPTHAPFWIKPDSTFGLFALTSLETDVHSRSTFRSPLAWIMHEARSRRNRNHGESTTCEQSNKR